MSLSLQLVWEFFNYCPTTGTITWRKTRNNRVRTGDRAGTVNKNGVWQVSFDHKTYIQHRVAWLYMTGGWPKQHIRHIDGNLANNAWGNLSEVPQGITQCYGCWHYSIKTFGVCIESGPFKSYDEAYTEYLIAKSMWHESCSI